MMKKMISLILALVMICSLATAASATGITGEPQKNNVSGDFTIEGNDKATPTVTPGENDKSTFQIGIEADYEERLPELTNDELNDVYKVEANYFVVVTWEVESTLTYYKDGKYVWKVELDEESGAATNAGYDIDYGELSGGQWDEESTASVKITVDNWSNRDVVATVAYEPIEGLTADTAFSVEDGEEFVAVEGDPELTLYTMAKDIAITDTVTRKSEPSTGTAKLDISNVQGDGIDAQNVIVGYATISLKAASGVDQETGETVYTELFESAENNG